MTKWSFVAGFIPTRPGSGRDGTLPLQKAGGGYKRSPTKKLLGDLLQFIHQLFSGNRWGKRFPIFLIKLDHFINYLAKFIKHLAFIPSMAATVKQLRATADEAIIDI